MRAEGDSAMEGDRENEEGAEKEIARGHAESIVARGDALAKYGVEGEAERTDKKSPRRVADSRRKRTTRIRA